MRRAGFLVAGRSRKGRGPSFLGKLASAANTFGSFLSGLPSAALRGIQSLGNRVRYAFTPSPPTQVQPLRPAKSMGDTPQIEGKNWITPAGPFYDTDPVIL